MYALSVKQPFASDIVIGNKTIEWRSKPWKHRGPLIICASLKPVVEVTKGVFMPVGMALGIVEMVDCRPFTREDLAPAGCRYYRGLVSGYAWVLENPREIEPVSVKGMVAPFIWRGPELVECPGWHKRHGIT